MESKNKEIGLRIKNLREDSRLTLLEFAAQIGWDNSSLGKMEKGKISLPLPILLEICSKFQVSADWILNGTETVPVSAPIGLTKEELLLKIYEAALNTKAYEKANAEMIKAMYKTVMKGDEAKINAWHAGLVERFLSEG